MTPAYSEVRYLLAKRTVDDRALNGEVLEALRSGLAALPHRPRVLELGAGAGTMLPRLAEWGVLGSAEYTLLDRNRSALVAARERLAPGVEPTRELAASATFVHGTARYDLRFVHADALAFTAHPAEKHGYDLILANAVLDLMDPAACLPELFVALTPAGLYWFSINFDGETIFLPEHALDANVMRLYHRTMDERVRDGARAGDSKCGRHLLEHLPASGATLLAAGSSDWVVFPQAGAYVADEAYFLHHIVNTVDHALRGMPELDASAFEAWVGLRHAQIERGELIYIAHQLDVFGRGPR